MHPTITRMQEVVASGDDTKIADLLAEDVKFLPPTYFATWTGNQRREMPSGWRSKCWTTSKITSRGERTA